jgi:hypothetical protein
MPISPSGCQLRAKEHPNLAGEVELFRLLGLSQDLCAAPVMPHLAFHTNPLSLPSGQDPLAFDKAEGAKNVALDRRGTVVG